MLAAASGLEDAWRALARPTPSLLRRDVGEELDAPLDVVGRRGREGARAPLLVPLGVLEAEALRGRPAGAGGSACSVP
ncbi:hypothetical protein [Actinomyces oris]|uniref:hypothetical protein n=1 Tax=Actinomyces oris TaxID=544580 RepID=UPI000A5C5D35|nr:hypothetical protein [Actinomyces oris]